MTIEQIIAELETIAAVETIEDVTGDEDYLDINDHVGGNIDDAYSSGHEAGRVAQARETLHMLKSLKS